MRYWKVKGANHSALNGEIYEKGQIVPTEIDLVAQFGKNKFKEVTKKGRPIGEEDDDEEEEDEEAEVLDDAAASDKKVASKETSKESKEATPAGDDEGESVESDAPELVKSTLGDDVTDHFDKETTSDMNLAVVKKGKRYHVVDKDEPNKDLSAEEKLENKAAVEKFIKGLLG